MKEKMDVEEEKSKKGDGLSSLSLLLHSAFALHVALAPYTKVEESWTLHAIHDILRYGVSSSALPLYDHQEHPGPVPRSFVGPLTLSGLSYPVQALLHRQGGGFTSPLFTQIIARLVLSQVNASAVIFFARRCRPFFGATIAKELILLSAMQFHVAFWAGRTVPNMLAFPLVLVALALALFPSSPRSAGSSASAVLGIGILTAVSVIIRAEVAALLAPLSLAALAQKQIRLRTLLLVGLLSTAFALVLCMPIDGYFWRGDGSKMLWAELDGILFNVFHGKSAEWGTSPFYTYFLAFLPRLLHVWLPFVAFAAIQDPPSRRLLANVGAFVGLLSLLGHKEWRFIVYIVPVLNVAALRGLGIAEKRLERHAQTYRIPRVSLFWLLALPTSALTALSTYISMHNYPGGQAMQELHRLRGATHPGSAVVHIDAQPAMTGASLFTHAREDSPRAAWEYDRTEDPVRLYQDMNAFDYLVTSAPDAYDARTWKVLVAAEGYAGMRRIGPIPYRPVFSPQIFVLEKKLV